MRIFLSVQQALKSHAVPAYAFWEYYFKNGLAEAKHEIVEAPGVDWAEGLLALDKAARAEWLERTWEKTIAVLRAEHARKPIQLFLSYLYPEQIEPEALREVRALGIPAVNFFCDNVREFTAVPAQYRGFDLHWVPEMAARPMYLAAGLQLIAAPMAVWVPPAFRTLPAGENDRVAFMGSHDLLREDLLGAAVELGLDFDLYGSGWMPSSAGGPPSPPRGRKLGNQFAFLRRHGLAGFAMRATYQLRRHRPNDWIASHWHPAIAQGTSYFDVTRESQAVIGINRYPSFRHSFSRPGRYSRLRDLEAPMLGACYLTENCPGLDELYEPGKEIETYENAAELVAKAARLRGDRVLRLRLREQGQRRALADHTIARTLAKISDKLGIRA